ncbi:hypothetical protein [Streptomyces hokutonensis]|uniref:hypothetical protein n=1 Tax=Streptomyces hokutonensis TaxID=1306990 RepID=UPI0003A6A136|nr:hypothetical protein [Streptomyces hokutonensis]
MILTRTFTTRGVPQGWRALVALLAWSGSASSFILCAAAAAQVGDSVIGVVHPVKGR